MNRITVSLGLAIGALALAGCDSAADPVASGAHGLAALPAAAAVPPDEMTGQGDAAHNASAHVGEMPARAVAKIPVALRGTWGMNPADCDGSLPSTDALLVVTADELRFQGSRGVPAADIETSDDSIAGEFAFADSARSWTRFHSLRVDKGQLTRTRSNPSQSFVYIRCSA